MDGEETNWSECVEDLVQEGEIEKAISLLESVVSKFETLNSSQSDHLQLSYALFDLAKLYSSKGLSLKADEASSRALLIKERSQKILSPLRDLKIDEDSSENCSETLNDDGHCGASYRKECPEDGHPERSSNLPNKASPHEEFPDDDWEAIADRPPEELLSPQCLPEVSTLSLENTKFQTPKRRGRGSFSYTTHGLYSDQQSNGSVVDCSENEAVCHRSEEDTQISNLKYGTRHVLVLTGFPPSTKTAYLEKLLENFKDRGVVIRWVNDTVALAVFRTPKIALEACNNIQCPFTVRVLNEDDMLLTSIPPRDLEPPRQRPETSTRTARRLIAQGMGIKLPTTNFGSRELRTQEEARRNRIVSRQNMRDDAWGDDVN
ncbi:uncharacterized protein LOC130770914 isoform X1 [Actinidia eriantha]|uniref:uncharacterized protein LOC130770914 isoform X1 n=1 Tax=Actinidia eriantha TaxID=165200 RepID=UPI00258D461D|nr:uncharacterized protein LOC130770914 isoform X1 [Actinidia eriantha]